jgi:hypothetical protein
MACVTVDGLERARMLGRYSREVGSEHCLNDERRMTVLAKL